MAWKKKLKRISYDVVSYIQIETEAIRDFNDKQMLSSYCLHKLEVVEWYIALIDAGSEKYIVPQTREQLRNNQNELKVLNKKITLSYGFMVSLSCNT